MKEIFKKKKLCLGTLIIKQFFGAMYVLYNLIRWKCFILDFSIQLVSITSPFSSQCNCLSSYIGSKMDFWWTPIVHWIHRLLLEKSLSQAKCFIPRSFVLFWYFILVTKTHRIESCGQDNPKVDFDIGFNNMNIISKSHFCKFHRSGCVVMQKCPIYFLHLKWAI